MTGLEILALPMKRGNDAKAKTIRDYLKALLAELWDREEGFSGKRPFGNSGWPHELYWSLEKKAKIKDRIEQNDAIFAAIAAL